MCLPQQSKLVERINEFLWGPPDRATALTIVDVIEGMFKMIRVVAKKVLHFRVRHPSNAYSALIAKYPIPGDLSNAQMIQARMVSSLATPGAMIRFGF